MKRAVWIFWLGASAVAQSAAPRPLSIDEAVRVAEARSEAVLVAKAGISRAESEVVRARSEWLPQLNGSLGYDGVIDPEVAPPETPPGSEPNPFALFFAPHIYRAHVDLSQNLYAGGRTVARQSLAAAGRRNAVIGLESARAQAVLETVQAYYDAVLADRLLKIAESNFKQAEATFAQTQVARERGTKPEFDLLRASVALENQRPVVLQRQMDRQTAQLRLKQILDLPLEEDVALTSALDENLPDLAPLSREVSGAPAADKDVARASVRQASEAVVMREAAVAMARSQHLPQVSVRSRAGYRAAPRNGRPIGADFLVVNSWSVGLDIQIPIFSGFRISGDVDSATADLLEARARQRQAEELARLDTRTSQHQIESAQAAWQASSGVVDQARKAYEIAQIRYREGISTQLELSDALLLFEQAQANRARAARDLQVARVRLSLLPFLPASAGAFGVASGASAAMADPSTGAGGAPSSSGGASQGAPAGAR